MWGVTVVWTLLTAGCWDDGAEPQPPVIVYCLDSDASGYLHPGQRGHWIRIIFLCQSSDREAGSNEDHHHILLWLWCHWGWQVERWERRAVIIHSTKGHTSTLLWQQEEWFRPSTLKHLWWNIFFNIFTLSAKCLSHKWWENVLLMIRNKKEKKV